MIRLDSCEWCGKVVDYKEGIFCIRIPPEIAKA